MTRRQPEAMPQIQVLTVAIRAISFMLTGAPAASTFDCEEEVDRAWEAIRSQVKSSKGTPEEKAALRTAQTALLRLWQHLFNHTRARTVGAKRLQQAAPIIAEMLDRAIQEEDYWADFAEGVLAEAEQIIEEVQAG